MLKPLSWAFEVAMGEQWLCGCHTHIALAHTISCWHDFVFIWLVTISLHMFSLCMRCADDDCFLFHNSNNRLNCDVRINQMHFMSTIHQAGMNSHIDFTSVVSIDRYELTHRITCSSSSLFLTWAFGCLLYCYAIILFQPRLFCAPFCFEFVGRLGKSLRLGLTV